MPYTWKGGKPQKKFPPPPQAITKIELLVLALLICDAAAGLASRLAGSLALAASAVLCAIAQITSLNGFNMLHCDVLR
jgi:hypothetical protein